MLTVSPKVAIEKMIAQTVLMGLNVDTKTGPLFLMAQLLELIHDPLTAPAYIYIYIYTNVLWFVLLYKWTINFFLTYK